MHYSDHAMNRLGAELAAADDRRMMARESLAKWHAEHANDPVPAPFVFGKPEAINKHDALAIVRNDYLFAADQFGDELQITAQAPTGEMGYSFLNLDEVRELRDWLNGFIECVESGDFAPQD